MNKKKQPSAKRVFEAVKHWNKNYHPFTCGGPAGCKQVTMEPEIRDNKTVLVCPQCSHVQDDIPTVVLKAYRSR